MITKEDFVNKICQTANELIARAKLENPRRMKDFSATIPICSSCFVDIDVEYEINDDGDICDLWIDFVYSSAECSVWLHRLADSDSVKNAAEELYRIMKEE